MLWVLEDGCIKTKKFKSNYAADFSICWKTFLSTTSVNGLVVSTLAGGPNYEHGRGCVENKFEFL